MHVVWCMRLQKSWTFHSVSSADASSFFLRVSHEWQNCFARPKQRCMTTAMQQWQSTDFRSSPHPFGVLNQPESRRYATNSQFVWPCVSTRLLVFIVSHRSHTKSNSQLSHWVAGPIGSALEPLRRAANDTQSISQYIKFLIYHQRPDQWLERSNSLFSAMFTRHVWGNLSLAIFFFPFDVWSWSFFLLCCCFLRSSRNVFNLTMTRLVLSFADNLYYSRETHS